MTWPGKFSTSHLQLPNVLSVLRGVLGALLPFFLLSEKPHWHLTAAGIFIFGAWTDYLDGWLARKYSTISKAGKILDPSMDKILILVPMVTFAWMGFYSIAWVVPILIREFIVTFCRIGWLLEGKALGAEKLGKLKFCVQTAAVSAAFFQLLGMGYPSAAGLGALLEKCLPYFLGTALVLTLISGVSFLYSNRTHFLTYPFAKYVSACGVGLIPIIPGTWGSAFGAGLALLSFWNSWLYAAVFLLFFLAGYWAVKRLDLSVLKDPQFVVVDEVLGMMITFAGVSLNWKSVLAGFILFRLLDIFKPPPCRQMEKLPGYWGILLDDVGAGIYARLLLWIFFR